MPSFPDRSRRTGFLRELIVPAIMSAGVGFYLLDSRGLSAEAMILPGVLIATIGLALSFAMFGAARRAAGIDSAPVPTDPGDESAGPISAWKPWLLIAVPLAMTVSMRDLGGLVATTALMFGAQLVFTRSRPAAGLAVAAAVAVPTYALFKYFLYVRFPDGALGLG